VKHLIPLAVFAILSVNPALQFGLGIGGFLGKKKNPRSIPLQMLILFLSIWIPWLLVRLVIYPILGDFFVFFLLLPLSCGLCMALELGAIRLFPLGMQEPRMFSASTGYGGMVPLTLFLTVQLASSVLEALGLAFFFAFGTFLTILILREIRRKSILEKLPRFLRTSPALLISLGLLSLIFSQAAELFFLILGNG